jgi:uncharacterized membrane protein YccC
MAAVSDAQRDSPGVWRQALASALRIDRSQIELLPALRCTLGVGAPLVAALALHQPGSGVFLAVGAVSTGFGSFQGAYRSRAAAMLSCAAGMAISLFVGSLAGHSLVAATAVAAGWGFCAGLAVALGPAATFVSLQSALAVLVAGAYPADLRDAIGRSVLVLAGGLFQTQLVVALWPLRRFRTERTLIADVYRSLADYAAALADASPVPPEPHTLAEIGSVLNDPQPFGRSSDQLVFRALLDEAERVRDSLAALSVASPPQRGRVVDALAAVLREIATAVDEGRAPAHLSTEWQVLDTAAHESHATTARLDALLGQLRAAFRLATLPAVKFGDHDGPARRLKPVSPVRDALMMLHANLSLESTAFRHALRLAAALALSTAVYLATGLPRGFWMSITALLVLRPEYGETYIRGIARIVGTLVGAGVATLLVDALGSHPAIVTALLLAFVCSGYLTFRANYAIFTICITGYIVLLLYLAGVPGLLAAEYRALNTILGGVLALAIYRAWPTWESKRTGEMLAAVADAFARDARVVFDAYVDPRRWNEDALQKARAAARLARSNAEASVARLLAEPARGRLEPRCAVSLVAAFRRFALAALALHAGLHIRPPALPQLAPLGDQIASALGTIAEALRTGGTPRAMPPLRETLGALEHMLNPSVMEQMDVMVDSVNTAASLLDRSSRSSSGAA